MKTDIQNNSSNSAHIYSPAPGKLRVAGAMNISTHNGTHKSHPNPREQPMKVTQIPHPARESNPVLPRGKPVRPPLRHRGSQEYTIYRDSSLKITLHIIHVAFKYPGFYLTKYIHTYTYISHLFKQQFLPGVHI